MKFNTKTQGANKTTNYEGAKAFKLTPEVELYTAVCTCIMQDKFYEKEKTQLIKIKKLLSKVSPEFVAKLAVYAREKMYLRSIPIVLAVELARIHKGDSLVSKLTNRIIQRADEITEILAYYEKQKNTKDTKKLNKLSKQIQKGIAQSFFKFNEYQFAKYNRDSSVKLKDALFITHPKPETDEQEELFKKIAEDKLEVPYTWEVELSKVGQQKFENETAKKAAVTAIWEELIDSKKLGYMAVLRNLRNILDAEVSANHIKTVASLLTNPRIIKKAKQFPFRFLSAYKMIKGNKSLRTNIILEALEEAVKVSIENVAGMDCDVMIASDTSGSMDSNLNSKSSVRYLDIGILLGQLMKLKIPSNIYGIFGGSFKVKRSASSTPLQNTTAVKNGEVGHSTNGYLVLDYLTENKVKVDKVMIFTDMQLWDTHYRNDMQGSWIEYKKFNPKAELYLFDLTGYGNTPVNNKTNDVYLIAGWSDKIFDMLEALKNKKSAVEEINNIEL